MDDDRRDGCSFHCILRYFAVYFGVFQWVLEGFGRFTSVDRLTKVTPKKEASWAVMEVQDGGITTPSAESKVD